MHHTSIVAYILYAAAVCLVSSVVAVDAAATGKLYAIGDLHGDYENTVRILSMTGLVDSSMTWIGGDYILVQLGDMMDRGPHGHSIIELFESLKRQAKNSGGEVITLLGNHEIMNLQGKTDFLHPGEVQAFGSRFAYKWAFRMEGPYGAILSKWDTAVVRHGTLFVHGGLLPMHASRGVDIVNEQMRRVIAERDWNNELVMNDGPVWTRELLRRYDTTGDCSLVDETLSILSEQERVKGNGPVHRIVVGHTIQPGGHMMDRCGGKLVAIDICISAYYGGCGFTGFLEIAPDPKGGHSSYRALYPSDPNYGKHSTAEPIERPTLVKAGMALDDHTNDNDGSVRRPSGLGSDGDEHRRNHYARTRRPLPQTAFGMGRPPYELGLAACAVVIWRLRHILKRRLSMVRKSESASV
eukprot:PhM_4_TR17501/c0_g1_i1/m.5191